MNKSRWQWIIVCVVVLLGLLRPLRTTFAVACSFPISPAGGTYALDQSCSVTADTLEGLDDANNIETATTNAAAIAVPTGITLTIPSGITGSTTLTTGTLTLTGGAIVVGSTNAQIKLNTALYVVDVDADGWAGNTTYYMATASGRRRLSLMRSRATTDCSDSLYSISNSCAKRRNIALTYSGTTLTNYDIVFSVDTATSIAAGNMTADCGDIRMKDSDGTTLLSYWIEGGCNTANTQVWTRVPSIPNGGKTIYMDYDGTTATDGFEAWSGLFTLTYNASCPAGWTQNSIFNNAFPQGAATSGGTGGASSHSHAQVSCTTGGPSATTSISTTQSVNAGYAWDTHTHTGAKVDISTASSVLPPYLDVVMCKKADLVIPASFIALFDTSVPSGWTRFSTLDNTFPRGATVYGGTGGSTTHSHSTTGGYTTSTHTSSNYTRFATPYRYIMTYSHNHTSLAGSTGTGTNTPPYLDMVFGQANAQTTATAGLIAITDVIPPLGWTRFTALDSKFPRGAATYGGTGGTTTHNHSVTISTSTAGWQDTVQSGTLSMSTSHSHSCSATSDSQSNTPPYTNTIFAKRNTPLPTASVGPEQ